MAVMKPVTDAQKTTHTVVETIMFTPEEASQWENPDCQRETKLNAKVMAIAEQIKRDGGVLPGILTLGIVAKKKYIVDGKHRRAAFLESGCEYGYADVRTCFFASMGELAREFCELNSSINKMKPDDFIRAMEWSNPSIQRVREECQFVGYGFIRRNPDAPILSMATTIRCWKMSDRDIPGTCGESAVDSAGQLTEEDADELIRFLKLAYTAWGNDVAYHKLWGTLNLVLCMWLYRRLVLTAYSAKTKRLSDDAFQACLMSLSASHQWLAYLVGRNMNDRDRAPAYVRIKQIFAGRLLADTGRKHLLPAPAWTHS